jgi:hypothetical protein
MSTIPKSNNEVSAEFMRLGGGYREYEDDDGGCWEFMLDRFIVHIEPWRRRSSLGIDCAIGHTELGALANQIAGNHPKTFRCLNWENHSIEVPDCEPLSEGFRKLLSSFLSDLGGRLDGFIAELRKPPPDIGGKYVFHLAALAWVGDFGTLEDYYAIFKRGKRMNFPPMITTEMIGRAVDIAMDRYCENH